MHMQFELKSDSWKSSVIYFARILQYWCILVSNVKISCGLICVCSDDSHEYTWIRYTHEFHHNLYYIILYTSQNLNEP